MFSTTIFVVFAVSFISVASGLHEEDVVTKCIQAGCTEVGSDLQLREGHAEEAEKKEELCMYFMVTFNALLLNFLKLLKIAGDFWLLTEDLRKIFRRWPVPSFYRSFRTLSKAFQIAVEDPLMFRPYNMYIWSLLNQFIASAPYS